METPSSRPLLAIVLVMMGGGGGGREDGKPYDALSNHHKLIVMLKTINDINFKYPLIIASFSESKLTKISALI